MTARVTPSLDQRMAPCRDTSVSSSPTRWLRLVVAGVASEGGQARESVLTEARTTRHRDGVPGLTATWFLDDPPENAQY
jgi:hypothetical protein